MAEQVESGAVVLERYRRMADGGVFECRRLEGEYSVRHGKHGETCGGAGDWLIHNGPTGERRVVPAAEFAAGFAVVEG